MHDEHSQGLNHFKFHSPQLLMVSGIGPASTLAWYNIPVLLDNSAVGQKDVGMYSIFCNPTQNFNRSKLTRYRIVPM